MHKGDIAHGHASLVLDIYRVNFNGPRVQKCQIATTEGCVAIHKGGVAHRHASLVLYICRVNFNAQEVYDSFSIGRKNPLRRPDQRLFWLLGVAGGAIERSCYFTSPHYANTYYGHLL